jgi:hypothetical protein
MIKHAIEGLGLAIGLVVVAGAVGWFYPEEHSKRLLEAHGFWVNAAAWFVIFWGTVTLAGISDAAWRRYSDRIGGRLQQIGRTGTIIGVVAVVLAAIAALLLFLVVSMMPVMFAASVYDALEQHGLDWGRVVRLGLLMGIPAIGCWVGLALLGLYLGDPTPSVRRYELGFKILLGTGVLMAVVLIATGFPDRLLDFGTPLNPLATIALGTLGLFLTRAHRPESSPSVLTRPAGLLWRNRGFLLACAIAAWLGLEAGGKGIGLIEWLRPAM